MIPTPTTDILTHFTTLLAKYPKLKLQKILTRSLHTHNHITWLQYFQGPEAHPDVTQQDIIHLRHLVHSRRGAARESLFDTFDLSGNKTRPKAPLPLTIIANVRITTMLPPIPKSEPPFHHAQSESNPFPAEACQAKGRCCGQPLDHHTTDQVP